MRACLGEVSGLSMLQIARRIRPLLRQGVVEAPACLRRRLPAKDSARDAVRVAEDGRDHGWRNGPARPACGAARIR